MKKLMAIMLAIGSFSSYAGTGECDLGVTGIYYEAPEYQAQVKSILKAKGYSNVQIIRRDQEFGRLMLHLDTETPGFNYTQYSQVVLADETIGTTEKYLFVVKRNSYRLGSSETYLKLLEQLPRCNDVVHEKLI